MRNYDGRLLRLNTAFLLFIVLMPFASGLFSSYATVRAPFVIYALVVMLAGLAQMLLQRYLRQPAHRLILPEDATHPDLDLWRPLVPVVSFLLAILAICLLPEHNNWPYIIPFTPLLILPLSWLHRRRYHRLFHLHQARQQPTAPEPALEPESIAELAPAPSATET